MASAYFKLLLIKRARRRKQKLADEQLLNLPLNENSTCRICLKQGTIPIYGNNDTVNLSEAVITFGDISLIEHDEYPKYLCDDCNKLLQNAILFRKYAKESDLKLRQKPEDVKQSDTSNDDILSNYSYDDAPSPICQKYCCKLCKINFVSWREYLLHKSSKKHKQTRVQCSVCNRILTSHLFKRHMSRHKSESQLICEVCGKMYRKDNLIRHLQLHSFTLPFQCQICPYRGRFMESLKVHMRTHTGDKPFSCDKCQLRFLTRSNLNRHLLTHRKERPLKCIECGRGFYTKRDLDVHLKADHAGIKDFSCRLCGNKYGTRKALMRHELRVHKRDKMAKGRVPLYLQTEYRK